MTNPMPGLTTPALPNGHDPVPASLTAQDMLSAHLTIDAWLKVSKFGMTIGDDTTVFDHIEVKTIKAELIWRRSWDTRRQAEMAIFEYINGFYNPRRRHSALGWKSPVAFERKVA